MKLLSLKQRKKDCEKDDIFHKMKLKSNAFLIINVISNKENAQISSFISINCSNH